MYDLISEFFGLIADIPAMVMNGEGLTVLAYILGTIFMSILVGVPLNALSRFIFRKGLIWGAPLFTAIIMLTLAVDGKFSLEYILHAGEVSIFLFAIVIVCIYPFMKVWRNLLTLKWKLIKAGENSKAVYLSLAMKENAWWLLYPTTLLFILYGAMRHKVYANSAVESALVNGLTESATAPRSFFFKDACTLTENPVDVMCHGFFYDD